jgi:hypothetical protein
VRWTLGDDTPPGAGRGTTVTQRVALAALGDLDAAPGRAALAFADERGPVVVPAAVRPVEDRLMVGIERRELPDGPSPQRATLVLDDGQYWFELRAIVRRGTVEPMEDGGEDAATEVTDGGDGHDPLVWLAFSTTSAIAWDYGRLHEEPTG